MISLVERIKQISIELGWSFNYGNGYWQNLEDYADDTAKPFEEKQIHCLFLWYDADYKFNEYGSITNSNFDGEMIISVRSRLDDEDYNQKYEDNIKKIRELLHQSFYPYFTNQCEDLNLTRAKEIEIANTYDTNLDGIKLQFSITAEYD